MTPIDRLNAVAAEWCAESGRSTARLATLVVNDGKFFERLGEVGKTTTTATLEKFARYFLDPVNWPGREIPAAANDFAHVMGVAHAAGVTAGPGAASPDNASHPIGAQTPDPAGTGTACDPGSSVAAADRDGGAGEPFGLSSQVAKVA